MSLQNRPGNPDIIFPPNNAGRQAIPVSRPRVGQPPRPGFERGPLIDTWAESPISGTYVLGSINGVVQWIQAESCD
jgi:hypothetical protein